MNRIQTNSSAGCSRHQIFWIVDRYILLMTQFLMLYEGERCVCCRRRRHSLFCDTKNLPLCNVAPLIIINQQPPSTPHPMKYVTRDYQSSTADHCCCRAGSLTTTGWSTPSSASPSSTWPPASPWSSCTPGGWRGWSQVGREEAPKHFFRRTAITSPHSQEFMV